MQRIKRINYLDSVLLSHLDDTRIDDWVDVRRIVSALLRVILSSKPLHDIETFRPVELNWIAIEEVRHHHEIPVRSKLIRDELCIVEFVADDISDAI